MAAELQNMAKTMYVVLQKQFGMQKIQVVAYKNNEHSESANLHHV